MAEKLAAGRVEIVVFGEISTGKSALINALVGEAVASVNVRGGWTKDVWHVGWEGAGYCVPGMDRSQVILIDTPGLNEVDPMLVIPIGDSVVPSRTWATRDLTRRGRGRG